MDMNERERLAESAKEFNASARPQHTYIERGISRKQTTRKEPEPKPAAEETKSYSDYRRERDTAHEDALRQKATVQALKNQLPKLFTNLFPICVFDFLDDLVLYIINLSVEFVHYSWNILKKL